MTLQSQPRILVLGGAGMLGHKMFQTAVACYRDTWVTLRGAKSDYPIQGIPAFDSPNVVERCDAMDLDAIDQLLTRLRPDVVINCVGVIKQRAESKSAIPSITINALLPHRIAATLSGWNGRLIHVSTDCVFAGDRGNYTETDLTDATDLYGRSKAMGEVVAESNALTIRTSIIGRELRTHASLLDWLLLQNGTTVRGFRRVWWSGVTNNYLAELILRLVAEHPRLSGLYQVTSGRINKHDLLIMLRDAWRLNVDVVPDETHVLDRSLDGSRFVQATGISTPGWESLLSQMLRDPTPYELTFDLKA